jgi:hypothetical protein
MKNSLMKCVVAVLLLAALSAGATTINFDESVSGDLPSAFFGQQPTILGDFGVGSNTVTGGMSAIGDFEFFDGGDSFVFSVPVGLQMTSAFVSAAHLNCGVAGECDWILNLWPASSGPGPWGVGGGYGGTEIVDMPLYLSVQPFPAGSYLVDIFASLQFGAPLDPLELRKIDYALTFNLAPPVPVPPAVLLLSSALAALGWMRRQPIYPGMR